MEPSEEHSYHLMNSRTGKQQEFTALSSARKALGDWIRLQRRAGEVLVEQDTGQWSDSRVTMWIVDETGAVVRIAG